MEGRGHIFWSERPPRRADTCQGMQWTFEGSDAGRSSVLCFRYGRGIEDPAAVRARRARRTAHEGGVQRVRSLLFSFDFLLSHRPHI